MACFQNCYIKTHYLLKMPRILVWDSLALLRAGFCIGTDEWFFNQLSHPKYFRASGCSRPHTTNYSTCRQSWSNAHQPYACSLFSSHSTTASEQSYALENTVIFLLPISTGRLVAKLLSTATNRDLNNNTGFPALNHFLYYTNTSSKTFFNTFMHINAALTSIFKLTKVSIISSLPMQFILQYLHILFSIFFYTGDCKIKVKVR